MRNRTILTGVSALAALLVLAGCSNSGSEHPAGHSTSASAAATPATVPGAEAHNDADVMFVQQMIPHHRQAVEMSDIVLAKQGIDPRVSGLATQIKAAQGPEIQQMGGWLSQWGNPPTPSGSGSMPGHASMPGMSGAGMMSEQDMTALKNAKGTEASKLFLTQMIAHHEGAISMAQSEIKDGQYPPAVAMARSIVTSQQQEIDTMNSILASL
jgi:uncharacterized protein (DUF305 family)